MGSPQVNSKHKENGTEQATKEHVRKAITKNEFRERASKLDSLGLEREQSEYRGFFNLITMGMVFFFLAAQTRHILSEGTLVGLQSSWSHFNRYDLFPSWILLVTYSFSAFWLQKLVLLRILPRVVVFILRVGIQVAFFVMGTVIAWERKWPFVQTAFFLLELLIILMKMHSYTMTNREYDKQLLAQPKKESKEESSDEDTSDTEEPKVKKMKYPNNVTFLNYLDFLMVPTLVYELEYPRTPKIRWGYFLEKMTSFFGLWAVMHVIVENYFLPILLDSTKMSALEAITHLIIPFTAGYLLIFYLVFDVACNGFAELTRFGDREFYSDWWNSLTWDEFARKWNKPVHEFLLRHVYLETINTYKISRKNATLITFLFSSIVHEFFMGMTLRIFRPWLFFFQMSQLPMIYILNPLFKKSPFSNYFFWFGLILGPPMISLLYARELFLIEAFLMQIK